MGLLILKNKLLIWGLVAVVVATGTTVGLVVGLNQTTNDDDPPRFYVDNEENIFRLDGEPFQYVSGSFHYFRALPETWEARLKTMKAANLNAVDTYVEWALHDPHGNGEYVFDGIADLVKFIELAQSLELYVILRPGPYICAERDNGGLPYWLFTKYPDIKPRTSDERYLNEVKIWFDKLLPMLVPHLIGNGGPIIMVQVENEYGGYGVDDQTYLLALRDQMQQYVEDKALLFTTDIPDDNMRLGVIPGVFVTTDFGLEKEDQVDQIWARLRQFQPTGPLVNSEFYPGWLTHWQEDNQRRDGEQLANLLRRILEQGASVNIYMFFGGTNFGFTAGANNWGIGEYQADITSYDYDAVMTEAGDPYREKFALISQVICDVLLKSENCIGMPPAEQKMSLPMITMSPVENLISSRGLTYLSEKTVTDSRLHSFEELDQFSGFVLYEIDLPTIRIDPTELTVNELRDRAYVYVDDVYVGTLSRENAIHTLPINVRTGYKLRLLVENQGRINFAVANDTKGIFGAVTLKEYDGSHRELSGTWTMTSIPLDKYEKINELLTSNDSPDESTIDISSGGVLRNGPVVFKSEFVIDQSTVIYDTYLDPSGWGKGVLFVNGFNLGRYWPLVGPQITMYVPKDLLVHGTNTVVMIECQRRSTDGIVHFTDTPSLDGFTG